MQLCCLRYLGFFPHNLFELPEAIVVYVAEQLTLQPDTFPAYAVREPTLFTHQQHILAHLHFRRATPMDMFALDAWLLERALIREVTSVTGEAVYDTDVTSRHHFVCQNSGQVIDLPEPLVETIRQLLKDAGKPYAQLELDEIELRGRC